jgi:glycosyltransferase involved in cell wall biosynthesis
MCSAAKTSPDVVRRALMSTAGSLKPDDRFYLLIDGGTLSDEATLLSAAAPVPVTIFSSREQNGLSAGLNRLIASALSEPDWTYFARMDADDESHPERMRRQLDFMEKNPDVDILGTGCREVDEADRLLQVKNMPLTHEQILAALPLRNPMNHPTVMFRRRVFESGLRYRSDVGLIEDYFLWADAAAAGFRFANLPDPLLNFTRDRNFFRRRSGWRQAKADFSARFHAMKTLRQVSAGNFFRALAALGLRLMPSSAQEFLYRRLR